MNKVLNKVAHYNLNLDYALDSCNLENQTNLLINNILNDFVFNILPKENIKNTLFVFEYNDDLLSLIGYHILLNIKVLNPEFDFKLYGKKKRTKKFLAKKQKFCSNWELRGKRKQIFLISSFNPIYKVINQKFFSNKIVQPRYQLLAKFTPEEIMTAQVFYHIGYIKNDLLNKKFIKEREDFSIWINKPKSKINENIAGIYGYYPKKVVVAWFDEDTENNIKLMQDLQDKDTLIFYYFNKKPEVLFDKLYGQLVKRKSNIPSEDFLNINEYDIPKFLSHRGSDFEIVGNWDLKDLEKLEG